MAECFFTYQTKMVKYADADMVKYANEAILLLRTTYKTMSCDFSEFLKGTIRVCKAEMSTFGVLAEIDFLFGDFSTCR